MSAEQGNMFISDPKPQSEAPPKKRRRRTMACTQCRSRKLKCDREYPTCGRCMKSKTPTKCTYEDGFLWQQPNTISSSAFSDHGGMGMNMSNSHCSAARPSSSPDSGIVPAPARTVPVSLGGRPPQHEKRDRFLETVLGSSNPTAVRQPNSNVAELLRSTTAPHAAGVSAYRARTPELVSISQQLNMENRVMTRGRETQTRFNGSGIFANLMVQFPELKPFVAGIKASNPSLIRIRQDMETIKRGHHKKKLKQPVPAPDLAALIGMLPSREMVDELVGLYCTYIESTHRILHVPSFRREIYEFWEKKANLDLVSAPFVVQLLLVLACAWYLIEPDRLSDGGATSPKRYTALDYIMQADKWLQHAQIKRPDIVILRIHCLLVIAKNNQGIKRSRAWLATGNMVKLAMMAGYHRDPDQWAKISTFNREMRRRIWTTIVELDVQVALDRGMPPTLQASDFDTVPALNINDEDIDEDTVELPPEKPLEEPTDTSFHVALSQSLPLRLRACALMNAPKITCSYEDIQKMDWEFTRFLSAIPSWSAFETAADNMNLKTTLWRALLENKLCQGLLAIHTPFAIDANMEPMFAPSSRARLEVATTMLSRQQLLHATSPQLSFCNLTESIPQACLSVFHHLYSTDSGYTSTLARRIIPAITDSLLTLIDKTLDALENKVRVVIKGAKHYFFLNMIQALVKSKLWPNETELYKKQVVDRIGTLAYNVLSRHTDARNDKINQETTPGSTSGLFSSSLDNIFQQTVDLSITPPGDFDAFLDAFDWEDLTGFSYVDNQSL